MGSKAVQDSIERPTKAPKTHLKNSKTLKKRDLEINPDFNSYWTNFGTILESILGTKTLQKREPVFGLHLQILSKNILFFKVFGIHGRPGKNRKDLGRNLPPFRPRWPQDSPKKPKGDPKMGRGGPRRHRTAPRSAEMAQLDLMLKLALGEDKQKQEPLGAPRKRRRNKPQFAGPWAKAC